MAGNVDFDAILSTTLNNYRPTLEDNVFTARALVFWLKDKGRIRLIDGGAKIIEPLMYAENTTAGSYSMYDTLSTAASAGISAAEYPWKQYAATIAIAGLEEAQNSGQEAIINLLEAKIQQAEETIAESMDVMFFADGSGNAGKDWNGLAAIVAATDPSVGALGNIPVATNTWWESYVNEANPGTPGTAVNLAVSQMSHTYNTVSRGNDNPDFIVTTQGLFESYEALLTPQLRFTDNNTADAGFQNLLYKRAPVVYDVYTPANKMYFLNSKYLKLVGHKDKWFQPTPFKVAPNQDARFAQILCYGNLTCSNRERLGVLIDVK